MAHLGPVAWPPGPIKTQRLVLRESEARDRAGLIELFSSPDVGTYVGGAQPREELERTVPETPGRRAGFFAVELDGTMIGMVTLDRRDAECLAPASSTSTALGTTHRQGHAWTVPRRPLVI